MEMEPSNLNQLGYLLCNPHTLPAWMLVAVAVWNVFITGRRQLAMQFLYAAWFALLILDLIGLKTLLQALFTPSGCGLWSPRVALLLWHVPHLALLTVTLPLVSLARTSPGRLLHDGGGAVLAAFVQVVAVIHLSLWFVVTPFGRLPATADYLALFTW